MGSRVTGWRLLSVTPRPCSVCLCVTKWAPVLFITAIIGWSYYAYVVELCFRTVDSALERTLFLVCYHAVLFMFVWAYYRTVMTPVARVPSQFQLSIADLSTFETTNDSRQQVQLVDSHVMAHALPLHTRSITGAMRYCDKCRHIKPDRCHHCSVCATCVLKMDHHCPWVNNCVGFSNYKFFLLFLVYAFLYCLYIALSSLKYFIGLLQTGSLASDGLGKFHVMFVFVVAALFSVSVVSLLGYHVYLVLLNRSTLEAFRAPIFLSGPDKHGFNMGRVNNFLEVFGDRRLLWFLPVFTSFGDGVSFPTRCHLASAGIGYGATSGATSGALTGVTVVDPVNTSMGDGVNFPQRHLDLDTDGLMGRQRWLESEVAADRSRPGDEARPGGAEFRVEIG